MKGAWINIYKPKSIGSTKITNLIKKLFKPLKVGHAGTLDPMAEGVLPIAIGEATKTIEFIHNARKTYEFEVIFGKRSDSGDMYGKIIEETSIIPDKKKIENVIPDFIGKIKQTPPKYSAIKINGKRAYDLAREGIEFEVKEREVNIYGLELTSFEGKKALFRAEVGLGTYIRSLAEDIAEKAGSIGVVSMLKRTKYDIFDEGKIFTPNIGEEKTIIDDLQYIKDSVIKLASSVDVVLDDIPVLHLEQTEIERLRNGQRLKFEAEKGFYRVYENNEFSLIAKQDDVLRPYKVFNL